MLKKYSIDYSLQLRKHSQPERHQYVTDDPVACEEFLQHLLEHGMGLQAIRHEGAELPKADFDRMVKVAVSGAASRMICSTHNIKPEEERFRFGFAA